jgi:sulfite oxidase
LAAHSGTNGVSQTPHAHAEGTMSDIANKSDGLVTLGDEPLVVETPESLLDDDTTPTEKFYIRNNGRIPERARDPESWTLTIDGEVHNPLVLTPAELKAKFETVTLRMVLECGGNGRSFFEPPVPGVCWTNGGIGCAEWTGVRVADVLRAAGVKPSAVFSGHFGGDPHLSGATDRQAMSRGVPIAKLMEEHNLIAWGMNGKPLETIHGFPLRLVIGGWPASVSTKWLKRIWIRDRVHDGPGMGGLSYRVPIRPMEPGEPADESNFRDLESMPVRSIITSPASGTRCPSGTREVMLRGASWAGDYAVQDVSVSIDYGATWQTTQLDAPKNRYDWQRWTSCLAIPSDGYYEIWSRATDTRGISQPYIAGFWNPEGYGGNPIHRIKLRVG